MTHARTHIQYIHHINITILPLLYTSSTPFGRPAGSDPSGLTQFLQGPRKPPKFFLIGLAATIFDSLLHAAEVKL
jgi:hypothetical protein